MGMDYRYAGSASYPRFDRELCAVAAALGAVETGHLRQRRDTENDRPLGYWFGFLSSDGSDAAKFAVPDTLPESVAKWLNKPYDDRTPDETAEIWQAVRAVPGIQSLSSQIWSELEHLAAWHEGWGLS